MDDELRDLEKRVKAMEGMWIAVIVGIVIGIIAAVAAALLTQ